MARPATPRLGLTRQHAGQVAAGSLLILAFAFSIWLAIDVVRGVRVAGTVVQLVPVKSDAAAAIVRYDYREHVGLEMLESRMLFGGGAREVGEAVALRLDPDRPLAVSSLAFEGDMLKFIGLLAAGALLVLVLERVGAWLTAVFRRVFGRGPSGVLGLGVRLSGMIGVASTALALASLGLVAVKGLAREADRFTGGERVQAVVERMEFAPDEKGHYQRLTPVQFTTAAGQELRLLAPRIVAMPGESLELRYEPDAARPVWRAEWTNLLSPIFIVLFVFGVMGSLFLVPLLRSREPHEVEDELEVRTSRDATRAADEDRPPSEHDELEPPKRVALDESSYATNAARIPLSLPRLRSQSFWSFGIWRRIRVWRDPSIAEKENPDIVAEHLWHGDSNPAVVLSIKPFDVAVYSWDIDAAVVLRFGGPPENLPGLVPGSRLLSANLYFRSDDGALADDLVPGPAHSGSWTNFFPIIADFYTDRQDLVEARKQTLAEDCWARTAELGAAALERNGGRTRASSPFLSWIPAF